MNLTHYLISLDLIVTIATTAVRACDLSNAIEKIIKGSTGENFVREMQTYGLNADKLTEIVEYCNNGSNDELSCITINIYKTLLLNKHNFELCLSSYIIYSGISCLDSCFKNYHIGCMECLGEHIPFIFDCLADGHIDYRPDYE
ncbi:hypothetical protein BMR1_03g04195 [Babesia microti strain RI]|uniref:Uncharacterized protein n=1 Tax=Babesia microti (strain RI) TaxID=1133968 RepID=A0A0K3AP57_BABMR|nr:hypothetical protein BMR1_03g04195 [Babesia microti strain RI]CTQ41439.1 hypothetical protein BMR1_03g04195 [Babesia microti strain RI]|eukprot:XP_012649450.1 hypothetical protein BMR1_03g04195 [Babesia microti strain RI]